MRVSSPDAPSASRTTSTTARFARKVVRCCAVQSALDAAVCPHPALQPSTAVRHTSHSLNDPSISSAVDPLLDVTPAGQRLEHHTTHLPACNRNKQSRGRGYAPLWTKGSETYRARARDSTGGILTDSHQLAPSHAQRNDYPSTDSPVDKRTNTAQHAWKQGCSWPYQRALFERRHAGPRTRNPFYATSKRGF